MSNAMRSMPTVWGALFQNQLSSPPTLTGPGKFRNGMVVEEHLTPQCILKISFGNSKNTPSVPVLTLSCATMSQLDTFAISATVVLIFLYLKRKNVRSFSHLPLPPGPKGLPVIGNLRDMPTRFEWKTYHKWSKELGMFWLMAFSAYDI